MITKQLDEALGIPHTPIEFNTSSKIPTVFNEDTAQDYKDDYDFVRDAIRQSITAMTTNLEEITSLASESESPRGFEVSATISSTIGNLAKQLIDLHKDNKQNKQEAQVINNTQNIFNGTTSELLKLLKESND